MIVCKVNVVLVIGFYFSFNEIDLAVIKSQMGYKDIGDFKVTSILVLFSTKKTFLSLVLVELVKCMEFRCSFSEHYDSNSVLGFFCVQLGLVQYAIKYIWT